MATLRRAAASVLRPGEPLVPLAVLDHPAQAWEAPPRCVPLWPVPDLPGPSRGRRCAFRGARRLGSACSGPRGLRCAAKVAALVTAPLHKEALAAAGFDPGHTELLQAEAAQRAGVPLTQMPVRMMLANDELRVVLVSIHVALRQALEAMTSRRCCKRWRCTTTRWPGCWGARHAWRWQASTPTLVRAA